MKPRILLTGGRGYIGSRLSLFFPDADSIDLELYGNPDGLPNRKRPYQCLQKRDIEPYDVIIHLAAHSSVAMCLDDPQGTVENNVIGFARLLPLCAGKRLIYASSASVYNGSGAEPVGEDWTGFRPANRYDASKYTMDLLAQTGEVEFYGLRFGTVCGWSPNLRTDLMINRMVRDAQQTGMITVANAAVHRPVLDIDDLCYAIGQIVGGEPRPGIYNLASFNATVREIGCAIADLCHVGIRTEQAVQTYDFSMSSEKFRATYGFEFYGTVENIVRGLVAHPPKRTGGRP